MTNPLASLKFVERLQNNKFSEGNKLSGKRLRAPVSMSASYTSTKAEEMIVLLRTLHSLDAWNQHINDFLCAHLLKVHDMVADKTKNLTVRSDWIISVLKLY